MDEWLQMQNEEVTADQWVAEVDRIQVTSVFLDWCTAIDVGFVVEKLSYLCYRFMLQSSVLVVFGTWS